MKVDGLLIAWLEAVLTPLLSFEPLLRGKCHEPAQPVFDPCRLGPASL